MTPLASSIAGLLLVFLFDVRAEPAAAQTPSVDLKTFVTSSYSQGLPYAAAHAYGPHAVPDLVAMLKDPSLEPHWTKIVAALGCIGDASAVQPLMDFTKRQQGEISADAFRAVLSVLTAIGQIAYVGDPAALKIITDFVDPGAYKSYGIGFVYGRYHDEALGELLARVDIMALGESGRPEALALLKGMLNDPALRPDWLDNVTEAIDLNEKMSSLGPEKVFGEGNEP